MLHGGGAMSSLLRRKCPRWTCPACNVDCGNKTKCPSCATPYEEIPFSLPAPPSAVPAARRPPRRAAAREAAEAEEALRRQLIQREVAAEFRHAACDAEDVDQPEGLRGPGGQPLTTQGGEADVLRMRSQMQQLLAREAALEASRARRTRVPEDDAGDNEEEELPVDPVEILRHPHLWQTWVEAYEASGRFQFRAALKECFVEPVASHPIIQEEMMRNVELIMALLPPRVPVLDRVADALASAIRPSFF